MAHLRLGGRALGRAGPCLVDRFPRPSRQILEHERHLRVIRQRDGAVELDLGAADHGSLTLQYPGRACIGESITKHSSKAVAPVETPPPSVMPFSSRPLKVRSMPLKI